MTLGRKIQNLNDATVDIKKTIAYAANMDLPKSLINDLSHSLDNINKVIDDLEKMKCIKCLGFGGQDYGAYGAKRSVCPKCKGTGIK